MKRVSMHVEDFRGMCLGWGRECAHHYIMILWIPYEVVSSTVVNIMFPPEVSQFSMCIDHPSYVFCPFYYVPCGQLHSEHISG